jgi:hypothetical protein
VALLDKKIFLIADTLPFETLLIYKNRKLFDFISKKDKWEKRLKTLEDHSKQFSEWTEPYKFMILKNDISTRTLSLIHPLAQLSFLAFIDKYDQEMIDYNKTHAIFSLRYPNKVNSIIKEKLEDDYDVNIRLDENTEKVNNDFEDKVDSYFSKGKFSKIHDFYNSYSMSRLETKYSVLLKIDYQNCFNSIYTHSLDWAYLGDRELSKQNIDKKNDRFSKVLDRVMQNANYGETNGIIVGPEFSRCVAEIVLSRIDNIVFQKLSDKKYIFKQ